MKKLNKVLLSVATVFLAMLFISTNVSANSKSQGTDLSIYQGNTAVFGLPSDEFSISQIGGYYSGRFVPQSTYRPQVTSTIAQGKRAHTYIYSEYNNNYQADQMLNYYLPRVQTPKGSIVALDVESGHPNTASIMYALNRIKQAGYTAMLYTSKSYASAHFNLQQISNSYPLWLAEYPDYAVRKSPNYNFFPSFNNVNIFQFTSTYRAGGLDGNIDLTGITHNGYNGTYKPATGGTVAKPATKPSAVKEGLQANKTRKSNIKVGDTVKVNFSAKRWSNGAGIANFVKGKSYKVIQVSGNKVLLANVMSWANKSDVEIVGKVSNSSASQTSSKVISVQRGDTLSSIAYRNNTTVAKLQALNGISNANFIRVGQRIIISGSAQARTNSVARYRIVQPQDTLSKISYLTGYSVNYLANKNGITNKNLLRVGQRIYY